MDSFDRIRSLALSALLGALAATALPAAAEIFQWKDAAGRLHFAQDLNQVPGEYREEAEAGVRKDGSGPEIQRYQPAPAAPAPARSARPAAAAARRGTPGRSGGGAGPSFRIPVERAGTAMIVQVRLNDQVTAPFRG